MTKSNQKSRNISKNIADNIILKYNKKASKEEILSEGIKTTFKSSRIILGTETVEEEVRNDWKNLLFFGENLEVLKLLISMNEQGGLVNNDGSKGIKMIYIDPPYATGDDYKAPGNIYAFSAKLVGASYLEFLRKRLILLKELLTSDGLIFVRIDYHYGHYIKAIMDEIFGQKNFINEIFVNRGRNMAGARGRKFEVDVDSILLYSKTAKYKLNTKEVMRERPVSEIKWTGFLLAETRNPRERIFLNKTLIPPEGQHWSLKQEKVDRILAEYHLRLRCKNKNCKTLYYQDESDASLFRNMKKKKHRFKFYDITAEKNVHGLKKLEKCIECGGEEFRVDYLGSPVKKLSNIWTDLESYSKNNNYPTENSELLLERIIKVGSNLGDIVLDCFAGSGTTGAVAEKLGRRWIMADFGELSIEIIQKRMLSLKEKIGNKGKKLLPIKSFTLFLPKN